MDLPELILNFLCSCKLKDYTTQEEESSWEYSNDSGTGLLEFKVSGLKILICLYVWIIMCQISFMCSKNYSNFSPYFSLNFSVPVIEFKKQINIFCGEFEGSVCIFVVFTMIFINSIMRLAETAGIASSNSRTVIS